LTIRRDEGGRGNESMESPAWVRGMEKEPPAKEVEARKLVLPLTARVLRPTIPGLHRLSSQRVVMLSPTLL